MHFDREAMGRSQSSGEWHISPRAADAYPFSQALFRQGGYSRQNPGFWIERPASKGYVTIIIPLSGCGRISLEDGTTFTLEGGEVFVSGPRGQGHREETEGVDAWEHLWLTFYSPSKILKSEDFDWQVVYTTESSLLKELVFKIIRADLGGGEYSLSSVELAQNLLIHTLRDMLNSRKSEEEMQLRNRFEHLWSDVMGSLDQEWDIKRLCSIMNFSRSQLTRQCRALYGQSPGEKIRQMRMEMAKRMLSNGVQTIMEVAETVGYSSLSLFSSSFASYEGMSPSSYRNMMRDVRSQSFVQVQQ